MAAVKPVDNDQRLRVHGGVYAIIEQDAKASNIVVVGILQLFSQYARVLIDHGSTYSFIAHDFIKHADTTPLLMDYILIVSTPFSKTMLAELVCKDP